MCPTGFFLKVRDTVAAQFEIAPTLRSGRNFHTHRSVDRFDIYFCTEGGIYHADVFVAQYEIALTRKVFMRFYADVNVQVAFRAIRNSFAVLTQANCRTVVYAGRDFELDGLSAAFGAFAAAHATHFFGHLALALTGWANRRLLNVAKYGSYSLHNLAVTLTGITGFELMTWFGRGAFAVATRVF
jgi:hypothetical protein